MEEKEESLNRRERPSLQFGKELEQIVTVFPQHVIATGPHASGKSTLANAAVTLGISAVHGEPIRGRFPDFALAGEDPDAALYQKYLSEDIEYRLGEYVTRFSALPPIVMIDEVLPEYGEHMGILHGALIEYYADRKQKPPQTLWVFQEQTAPSLIDSQTFSMIPETSQMRSVLQSAHILELPAREAIATANNAAFVAAARNPALLQDALGPTVYSQLMGHIQHSMLSP